MKTVSLWAIALAVAIIPPLASLGCNNRDDSAPVPAVAQPTVAPPPTVPPPVAAPVTVLAPVAAAPVPARPMPARADAGARDGAVAAAVFDASILTFPSFPALHPSALPAIASGIVGGIIAALPSGVVPPPPATSK